MTLTNLELSLDIVRLVHCRDCEDVSLGVDKARTWLTISALDIQRILQGDDIFSSEWLIRHQIEPM